LAGFGLLLLFAYAISWVMAWVGLMVPSVDVINNASFVVIMPLTFVSNAFVPTQSFDGVLLRIVEWNPVSSLTLASRELFGNIPAGAPPESDAWSLVHPAAYTLIWVALILVVFVPLSVRQYQRATSK
jgi:ABC-type multidrug transport system permease subunit